MRLLTNLQKHLPQITNPNFFRKNFTKQTLQTLQFETPMMGLGLCNDIPSLKKTHSLIIIHGLSNHLSYQTKLVSLYGVQGEVERARSVFDRIRNPDLYSWKVMFRWYFLNYLYFEVIEFYTCLRKCLKENDNAVFSYVLKACSELCGLDMGRRVHCQIVKVGNPDSVVVTGIANMYAKCGEIECSRRVFDEYPGGNVVSWTSMIVGYVQNDRSGDGLVLFNQMRECVVEPNEFTIGTLLTACTKLDALHQGKWVHGYMISKGIDSNSFSVAALVDMYVKCGAVTDARLVFDGLITADFVPWTAMIVGYSQRNYPVEALALFTDRKWVGVMPNSVTITSVLSACAQSNSTDFGRSVHTLGIKLGLEDASMANALVHMYAKCRMIKEASCIFDRISEKDVVSWNSMITGYSQNGFASEALSLFCQMRYSYSLDPITMVSVLSACACIGAHKIGCALHSHSIKDGFLSSNIYVGTALLNLYSKSGDSESSRRVFDEMGDKNIVTWSAMMSGYGMHGDVTGSVTLFSEMLKENLEPNEVVFTNILSACGHTGMVGEGWSFFQSMCKEYHVIPSMKHYVCMVDLLARAGKIEEAMDFIERIPIQSDERVWGALLHGCRLHSRLDLGEVAARRMLELQPDSAGYYVLISNFFASDGRWTQADKLRELMKERRLSKFPGCSLVEMDQSHHPSSSLKVAPLP